MNPQKPGKSPFSKAAAILLACILAFGLLPSASGQALVREANPNPTSLAGTPVSEPTTEEAEEPSADCR